MAYDESEYSEGTLRGRKFARRTYLEYLAENGLPYACEGSQLGEPCGLGPDTLPSGAPENLRLGDKQVSEGVPGHHLQVDHKDKDISNNDVSNLQLLCVSCHKVKDTQEETPTGPPTRKKSDPYGYALNFLHFHGLMQDDDPNIGTSAEETLIKEKLDIDPE